MEEMIYHELRSYLSAPYAILIITETTKRHVPPFEDKLSCIEAVYKIMYDKENNEFHAKLME